MNEFFDAFFFGPGRRKNGRKGASIQKGWTGLNIFYRLLNLTLSRFKWNNLPDTMDARFLEMCLVTDAQAAVANTDKGIMNLRVMSGNPLSPYGYYNTIQLGDYQGRYYGNYIPDCPGNVMPDAVLVYDNIYNVPTISRIKWYADRLTDIDTGIRAALGNLKATTIIQCTKEQEPAVRRAWDAADVGVPVIFSFGQMEGAFSQPPAIITNPQTAEILKSLQEAYDKTMSQFLEEMGIESHGVINKLSGVSEGELARTEQATHLNLQQALDMRIQACEKMSDLFGLDVSVEKRTSDEDFNFSIMEGGRNYERNDMENI